MIWLQWSWGKAQTPAMHHPHPIQETLPLDPCKHRQKGIPAKKPGWTQVLIDGIGLNGVGTIGGISLPWELGEGSQKSSVGSTAPTCHVTPSKAALLSYLSNSTVPDQRCMLWLYLSSLAKLNLEQSKIATDQIQLIQRLKGNDFWVVELSL
jgi:hypothetical protein